jgi:hypothetical protein
MVNGQKRVIQFYNEITVSLGFLTKQIWKTCRSFQINQVKVKL